MRRSILASAAALVFVLPAFAVGQSSNGRISGTVVDATGALIQATDSPIFGANDTTFAGVSAANLTLGSTPTIAVVDQAGNLLPPSTNPDGTPHNGILLYASVFGELQNTPEIDEKSGSRALKVQLRIDF